MESISDILDLEEFVGELNSFTVEKKMINISKSTTNKEILIKKIKQTSCKELARLIFVHQNCAIQCSVCPIGGRKKCADFLSDFGPGYCKGCEKTLELWLESVG